MKTSSFFLYFGPGRISIARGTPRGISGYVRYPALAPTYAMLTLPEPKFRRFYHGLVLSRLEPARVLAELHELAGDAEPVLLCFERLQTPGEWCHRRLAAEWLERSLGVDIPELVITR